MSTHSCIKFLTVVFLQLLVMAGLDTATAQPDPNFQSRIDQFTSPPPIQPPVFSTNHPSSRGVRHPVKRHNAGRPKQKNQ
jgi:hypothetical protein